MKQAQQPFTLQSDFSQLKVVGEVALQHIHIDLAIYDLMTDGKKRSVNEVVSALTTLGYQRDDINRRMVVLLHKKNMFDEAKGGRGKSVYQLKKGAKRPFAKTDSLVTSGNVRASEIVVPAPADKPFAQTRTVAVTYKKPRTLNIQENNMSKESIKEQVHIGGSITVADLAAKLHTKASNIIRQLMAFGHDVTLNQTIDQDLAVQVGQALGYPVKHAPVSVEETHEEIRKLLSDGHKDPTSSHADGDVGGDLQNVELLLHRPPEMPKHVVELSDPVRVAIWKTMQDGDQYTIDELHVLLDHISRATLQAAMLDMKNECQFEVERSGVLAPIQYRLKPGVPMPEGFPNYRPKLGNRKGAPKPPQQLTLEDNVQDQSLNTAASSGTIDNSGVTVTSNRGVDMYPPVRADEGKEVLCTTGTDQPPKEVPLVDIPTIKIVGQDFTYREARELLKELKAAGFGHQQFVDNRKVGKHLTVAYQITVGLTEVTVFQANDIALMLIDELE